MDYDRIILEMLDRIKNLEDKVEKMEKASELKQPSGEVEEVSNSKKYRYLSEYLKTSGRKTVSMSFDEIEQIVGFNLPSSARSHRAFWANSTTHSIALSWLSVGYKTVEVNITSENVTFEKE